MRPRWVYTDSVGAVDYTMSLEQRPWDPESGSVGGSDETATGIPASFEILRRPLLHLTLRFPESEWASVERLVRHLQRSGSATMYPDQSVAGTSHAVYGESPKMGEGIRPRRGDEPSTLELDVTVRRTTSGIFTDEYFGSGA